MGKSRLKPGGTPGGADREIQFNNAGAFGAASDLVYDSNSELGIGTSSPSAKLHVSETNTSGDVVAVRSRVLVDSGSVDRVRGVDIFVDNDGSEVNDDLTGLRCGVEFNGGTQDGDMFSGYFSVDANADPDGSCEILHLQGSNYVDYALYSNSTAPSYFAGDVVVPTEVYGPLWNGSNEVPTKDALYDKIETIGGGVDQEQIFYVGKHGNDANDGLTPDKAVLTFGQAIALATAQVPSATNKFTLQCSDAGIYNESLTIPSYVAINAPKIELNGNQIVEDRSALNIFSGLCDTGIYISKDTGTNHATISFQRITLTHDAIGIRCRSGELNIEGKILLVEGGTGIQLPLDSNINVVLNHIYISDTGTGISLDAGEFTLVCNKISDDGDGTGITIGHAGLLDAHVASIDCDVAYFVYADSALNLHCPNIQGTRTGAGPDVRVVTANGDCHLKGNVGIGTSTPDHALTIKNVADNTGIKIINESNDRFRFIASNSSQGGNVSIYDGSNNITGRIRGYASSGVQAYFTAGKIGVGTETPTALVHVNSWDIDSTGTEVGIRSEVRKTAGVTDTSDFFYGIKTVSDFEQAGGILGGVYGSASTTYMVDGTTNYVFGQDTRIIMSGGTVPIAVYGARTTVDLNAGTVTGDVYGEQIQVQLDAGLTSVDGNVIGLHVSMALDEDPVGTAMGIYITGNTNVDYSLYSQSTAPAYFNSDVTVSPEAYGASWNGSNEVPTKNDVYDKIETIGGGSDNISSTPAADHTANGPQCNDILAGEAVTALQICFMSSDGRWWRTDADAETTSKGMLGLSLAAGTAGAAMNVALPGSFVRDDSWTWTVGGPIYLSTTIGELTQTAPTASGDVVRCVGYATHADRMFFDYDKTYVVLA